MAKLNTAQVKTVAKQKVAAAPEGVRWTTLVNEIKAEYPETPINTIWGCTNSLFKDDPDIIKVSKGIYALAGQTADAETEAASPPSKDGGAAEFQKSPYEKDFYQPFAEWLRDGLEEVTEALSIGGNIFKGNGQRRT